MRKFVLVWMGLIPAFWGFSQGSFGDIRGQVFLDSSSITPLEFAKIWVERGSSRFGATSDEKGNFIIHAIPPGIYPLNIYYAGDTLSHKVFAKVLSNGIARLGRINLHADLLKKLNGVKVTAFKDPLIHSVFGETRIDPIDIKKSPAKNNIKDLIQSRSSAIHVTPSGKLVVRGARPGDLTSYIDGVKMRTVTQIPSSAIGGITIFTSAIPAKYGDTTGGVIIMETKSYYDLWRRWKMMQAIASK